MPCVPWETQSIKIMCCTSNALLKTKCILCCNTIVKPQECSQFFKHDSSDVNRSKDWVKCLSNKVRRHEYDIKLELSLLHERTQVT